MDQESWSFLFKRWSDDYGSFQKLRHEFASLQQQYDSLLSQFQALQQERERETQARSIAVQDVHINEQDVGQWECETLRQMLDLSAAEVQFLKNQNQDLHEALCRHEEQAANSAQSISTLSEDLQRLSLEKTSISKQRDQLSQKCDEMAHKYEDLQHNVNMAHNANKNFEDQATEATRKIEAIHAELARVTAIANQFEEVEASHQQMMASYEKQIQDMILLLRAKEIEKKALGEELTSCRDHLQKLRDSRKSLTSTVTNVQGMIINKLNGAHTSSSDTAQARPTTHQHTPQKDISAALPNKQQSDGVGSNNGGQNPSNTTQCLTVCISKVASKGTQPAPKTALNPTAECLHNLTTDSSPMPLARRQMFVDCPPVVPDITEVREKDLFERNFLKATIGGTIQSLIVRVTDSQTALAKARLITTYLCPGLDHNPWCPTAPCEHGYMFVGLGREKDTFLEPQDYNVFVGLLKSKNNERRKYRYMGVYRAVRVPPLTVNEWNTLSESVKETYVLRTKEKSSDSRTLAQIRTAYDHEQLMVPCVKLQCVDFDRVLFSKLVEANSLPLSTPVNKGAFSSAKRRRMSNEESARGSHKKKITFI